MLLLLRVLSLPCHFLPIFVANVPLTKNCFRIVIIISFISFMNSNRLLALLLMRGRRDHIICFVYLHFYSSIRCFFTYDDLFFLFFIIIGLQMLRLLVNYLVIDMIRQHLKVIFLFTLFYYSFLVVLSSKWVFFCVLNYNISIITCDKSSWLRVWLLFLLLLQLCYWLVQYSAWDTTSTLVINLVRGA